MTSRSRSFELSPRSGDDKSAIGAAGAGKDANSAQDKGKGNDGGEIQWESPMDGGAEDEDMNEDEKDRYRGNAIEGEIGEVVDGNGAKVISVGPGLEAEEEAEELDANDRAEALMGRASHANARAARRRSLADAMAQGNPYDSD